MEDKELLLDAPPLYTSAIVTVPHAASTGNQSQYLASYIAHASRPGCYTMITSDHMHQ